MLNTEYFTKVGQYFGYPQCCIDEFISFYNTGKPERNVTQVKNATCSGFVVCHTHSHLIANSDTKLKDLLVNRVSKSVFPIDDSLEDIRYINSLKS